jgi:3'-phosphoadenosine 5'-phosphosulfate sulfotransferase
MTQRLHGADGFSLKEDTLVGAEQHDAQCNSARNTNSQVKRKRIVSLLFVVVDTMQNRFRNLRVHAEVYRKLNQPRYFFRLTTERDSKISAGLSRVRV